MSACVLECGSLLSWLVHKYGDVFGRAVGVGCVVAQGRRPVSE
jgi:hypothetical protein